jgi:uncharacterized membrane protein YdjX (TVP38/TMEM64 family)
MHFGRYKNWRYKNTTLLLVSLVIFFYFLDAPPVHRFILTLGDLGFLGAFITGMLFVSTFTVAPATVLLFYLADKYHPIEIALIAGLGSVLGDYLIFRFLKDKIFDELTPLFEKYAGGHFLTLLHTPYFSWFSPVLGALLIMSPFPDELGLGLLGLSKLRIWEFLLLTFVLDVAGIFIIVSLARLT